MTQLASLQEAPLTDIKNFLSPKGGKAFFFITSDKVKIRVAIWNSNSARGTVILQSGRTEFIEKYYEVVQEFLDRDFCVAMFDWRGQGLSDRLIDNPYLGHVSDFSLYDQELKEILDLVYVSNCPKPWIGIGHSMGGCLIASLAAEHSGVFDLIILCAPMLSLKLPKSMEIFVLVLGEISRLGFRNRALPQPEWKERKGWHEIPFEENDVTSDKSRFTRSVDLIRKNENLALGGLSLAWVHESIKRTRKFSKPNWSQKITSPTLLLSATKDQVVNSEKNELICQTIPKISIARIEGNHELFMEQDHIREETWQQIDKFLKRYL